MPANTFEDVVFGVNLRGFYTDINIYARFFTEKEMKTWTSSCTQSNGEIFAWNAGKVNITQGFGSPLNVTISSKSRREVCQIPTSRRSLKNQVK